MLRTWKGCWNWLCSWNLNWRCAGNCPRGGRCWCGWNPVNWLNFCWSGARAPNPGWATPDGTEPLAVIWAAFARAWAIRAWKTKSARACMNACVHLCVCMCVWVYMCVYVYIYIYEYGYVYAYVCVLVYCTAKSFGEGAFEAIGFEATVLHIFWNNNTIWGDSTSHILEQQCSLNRQYEPFDLTFVYLNYNIMLLTRLFWDKTADFVENPFVAKKNRKKKIEWQR